MKEGSYAEKGVGHIHLKPVSSSKKTQLIIRADTSLGNLLLNIVLNSAMPVAKQGKNNVVISCVPNPPVDEKNSDKVSCMCFHNDNLNHFLVFALRVELLMLA